MRQAINKKDVVTFVHFLAGNGPVDWRTLNTNKRNLQFTGTPEEVFETLFAEHQENGEVFMVVNRTNGEGQADANINEIRALFADLDGCPRENLEKIPIKPHMVVTTSPGKYHAYWKVDGLPVAEFKPLQQKIAELCESDRSISNPSRIMRVPGFFHLKGEPYLSNIEEINEHPTYTPEEVRNALNCFSEHKTLSKDNTEFKITRPLADGERTDGLTHLCGKLISQGLDDNTALMAIRAWNANNTPPLEDSKLVSTLASIRSCDNRNHPEEEIIAEFNREYAVAQIGGKTTVIWEDQELNFMSFQSFKEFHSNKGMIDKTPVAAYWLNHPKRRTYRGVVFDPTRGADNDRYYNLWKGFACEPIRGDCTLYLQHIHDNVASGEQSVYNYILDWMADAVQNPGNLPGVALVLLGKQGTGKGVFARYFGQLFGCHFKHVQTADQFTGKFTKHLSDACIIYADEVVWGGDKQREGALKTLITEPTRIIEAKGKDAITMNNYARVIMSTNEAWAVPAGLEERRYCVVEVSEKRMQDSEYFYQIAKQMDNGGLSALLYFLLHREIKSNIRIFPKTNALLEQKEKSLDSVGSWWMHCLKTGTIEPWSEEWPEWKSTEGLFRSYAEFSDRDKYARSKATSSSELVKALKQYAHLSPSRKTVENHSSFICTGDKNTRIRGYSIPDLAACRHDFEQALQQEILWEEND